MTYNGNEGKAYIAGWIIKMLAAAFLTVSFAWAQHITTTVSAQTVQQAVAAQKQLTSDIQLNRIEGKLDLIIEGRYTPTPLAKSK